MLNQLRDVRGRFAGAQGEQEFHDDDTQVTPELLSTVLAGAHSEQTDGQHDHEVTPVTVPEFTSPGRRRDTTVLARAQAATRIKTKLRELEDRDRRFNHDDRFGIARGNRAHYSINAARIERIGVGIIISWRCNKDDVG